MLPRLRVLDLSEEPGHLAGKILGDLGADVVKIEPPGGDPLRRRGPFVADQPGIERGLPWLALNTSKRSVVADLESTEGRRRLVDLAAVADVLIETEPPGTMARRGLGFEELRAVNPSLVYCAITPFGQQGPYASYGGHDLVVVAMGGNAAMTGDPALPPVRCSLPTAYYHAAPEAVLGILMALWARLTSGRGQHVDVSLQECQLASLITGAGQYAHHGRLSTRAGGLMGRTREIWRAKDGWVSFGLRGGPSRIPSLEATVEYMADCGMAPPWLRAYDWRSYSHITASADELERLEAVLGTFFASRSMRELYDEALERRILLAPCNDAREILEQAQLRSRKLFTERTYPKLGVTIEHPNTFAQCSPGEIAIRSNAPRLGAHEQEVIADWMGSPSPAAAAPESAPDERARFRGTFDGLRILELGAGAAGPAATSYFARQGAAVIRIESGKRPDFLRLLHMTPDNRDEPGILDRAPMFMLLNPNKQSFSVNMKTEQGIGLVKDLVAWADVVSENFAPGVMERWGLDAPSLHAIKPGLVVASASLFGQTGPQRSYPGFGGQGSAISGFNHLTGRPDAEAHGPYATITDSLSPRYVAVCIAAALLERRRSGQGQTIDLSQIEAGVYSLSEMVVRHSARGEVITRVGNHCPFAAPHGVYPCAGSDRWIAIAVFDHPSWESLVSVMGSPDWALSPAFGTVEGRLADEEQLDGHIGAWTATFDAHELMAILQEAGVEAGVVQDNRDLLRDPQLALREHFVPLEHPALGELLFERSGFRLSDAQETVKSPGPLLGADTQSILKKALGRRDTEIAILAEAGTLS